MNDGRDRGSAGAGPAAMGGPEEEPTVETEGSSVDEEPTLETEPQGSERTDGPAAQTRSGSGWGSRLERMTAVKKARRRMLLSRFWLAAIPVFLLVVVAMILLAMYGGQGGGDPGSATTVVPARVAAEGSSLLLVRDEDRLVMVALMHPWERGGVVLTIPGVTLLESEGAFQELSVTYRAGGPEAVKASMGEALDMPMGPAAVVDWSELETTLGAVGAEGVPIEVMVVQQGEIVAQAIRDSVAGEGPSGGWNELSLGGERAEFLAAIAVDADSMTEDVWSAGALGGTIVDGEGFWYLEPDIGAARALLFVDAETVVVSVEIRDGAGVEGAARAAGALIETAGFILAPMSYAEGYPGVQKTQILVAGESAPEAQQVRSILGVGDIVIDGAIANNVVIVLLGKDYEIVTATSLSTESGE